MRLAHLLPAAAAAAVLVLAGPARAAYPDRPITLVVPFVPGGANDAVARIVAKEMGTALRQPVVVDNRPGAGGALGTDLVAKAAPDGHTLLLVSAAHAISGAIYARLPYDPVNDFAGVTQLTRTAYVLVVAESNAARSVAELTAQCKARAGGCNYASSGKGSAPHLAGALYSNQMQSPMTHIPYKGGAPALLDVMRGDVTMYFSSASGAIPQIKGGKVRPLAVTTATRSPALPEVPTMAEAGLPGFEVASWYGIAVPARTPRAVIDQLNGVIAKVLADPAVRSRLAEQGEEAVSNAPEVFQRFLQSETQRYARIAEMAKIVPE